MVAYPLISVIILNYNGKGFLEDCVVSVLKSDYPNFEAILVDNGSSDDSVAIVEKEFSQDNRLKIIRNSQNLMFAGGNNTGILRAKGELIVILNNDTVVESNWLKEIAEAMQDERIAAAQTKMLVYGSSPAILDYTVNTMDRYGFCNSIGRGTIDRGQYDGTGEIFYAAGAALVLRKRVLGEVGLFDEKFGAHWEDVDLCWRIRLKGYKICFIPKAVVYHKGSITMTRFAKKTAVSWYVRKNRIAGLIKNYSTANLIMNLPILILIYFLLFMWELISVRDTGYAISFPMAILWNIENLPYLLKERKRIQKQIRIVSDKDISVFFAKRPVFMEFLNKILKG